MKKLLCALTLLLTLAMLGSLTAAAAVADDGDLYAVATTVNGDDVILSDAPAAEEIADLESYDLMIEEESVLTVEQSTPPMLTAGADNNGYFSARFMLPDTTKQAFLVGLSADKVEEIQGKIIANYAKGANFTLTDLSFIDTEKTRDADGDDQMCWAASSSNILTYTGWAAQAGFTNTDDLFENYIASFTNAGGNAYYGLGWFFNGVNTFPKMSSTAASATEGTGGYLTDYAFDTLTETVAVFGEDLSAMERINNMLDNGYGIVLSLDVTFQGTESGGHSISCWGYISDTAYTPDNANYYAGLFITDSDSDELRGKDRREAYNNLQCVELSNGLTSNGLPYFHFDLDSNNHGVIIEFTYLMPYSADVAKETDSAASRDKVNSPDITIKKAYLNTDFSKSSVRAPKIESNTGFFYTPIITNEADTGYNGKTRIAVTVTDADGNTAFTRNLNTNLSVGTGYSVSFGTGLTYDTGLAEGDYTFTISMNDNHAISEAYYYNNTYSFPLKVRDSYLLGDADGSGAVEIMDATKIQRIMVGRENADEKTKQRAVMTGSKLNIMDATAIQRHIANYTTSYPVGEKRLYD